MSRPSSSSPALPIAHVALRILIVVNWLVMALTLTLLFGVPNEQWIMSALDLSPSAEADGIVTGLRAIAGIGLVMVPINYGILQRLMAMVATVRAGDPFVAANGERLKVIAWSLLALQVLAMAMGAIGDRISSPAHPIDIDAGFSVNGWLAVLLTFLLARVFAEGTRMRDDLEGTV